MGQMVIRVALQCNEADAYLIMDEGNPAPRLLSRPGEGIYNDAAGAVEGPGAGAAAVEPVAVGAGDCDGDCTCEIAGADNAAAMAATASESFVSDMGFPFEWAEEQAASGRSARGMPSSTDAVESM